LTLTASVPSIDTRAQPWLAAVIAIQSIDVPSKATLTPVPVVRP
jgi:hypothetical protein